MQLFYYRGFSGKTNFGDELNRMIWPRLLPGCFDEDPREIFVGIGTLLKDSLPKADKTFIMGSGAGYGNLPSASQRRTWITYCVRGHLTAGVLGLPAYLVATDPAILVYRLQSSRHVVSKGTVYMPHWFNAGEGLQQICSNLGISYLDPFEEPQALLDAIGGAELVLAEAMHAAITADALRVPWVSVTSNFSDYSPFKWRDWCSSLDLKYEPFLMSRAWHPQQTRRSVKAWTKAAFRPMNQLLVERQLRRAIRVAKPCLSSDKQFLSALNRVEDAIGSFRTHRESSIDVRADCSRDVWPV